MNISKFLKSWLIIPFALEDMKFDTRRKAYWLLLRSFIALLFAHLLIYYFLWNEDLYFI